LHPGVGGFKQKRLAADLSFRKNKTNRRERADSNLDGLKTASFAKDIQPPDACMIQINFKEKSL